MYCEAFVVPSSLATRFIALVMPWQFRCFHLPVDLTDSLTKPTPSLILLIMNGGTAVLRPLSSLIVSSRRAMPLIHHQSEYHGFDGKSFTRRTPLHRCPEIVPPKSFDPSEIRRRQRWRKALWIVLSIFLIIAVELILIRIDFCYSSVYAAQRRP